MPYLRLWPVSRTGVWDRDGRGGGSGREEGGGGNVVVVVAVLRESQRRRSKVCAASRALCQRFADCCLKIQPLATTT